MDTVLAEFVSTYGVRPVRRRELANGVQWSVEDGILVALEPQDNGPDHVTVLSPHVLAAAGDE